MGAHMLNSLNKGIGGVAVGIINEKMVVILGTAEEGALSSLTAEGKIIVNNPHKADLELSALNQSLSNQHINLVTWHKRSNYIKEVTKIMNKRVEIVATLGPRLKSVNW